MLRIEQSSTFFVVVVVVIVVTTMVVFYYDKFVHVCWCFCLKNMWCDTIARDANQHTEGMICTHITSYDYDYLNVFPLLHLSLLAFISTSIR
jgi:hypothetical protein